MDVALVMAVDVEEVDGAKDPEVHGGHPDPCCFQKAQAQQAGSSRLGLRLVPYISRVEGEQTEGNSGFLSLSNWVDCCCLVAQSCSTL